MKEIFENKNRKKEILLTSSTIGILFFIAILSILVQGYRFNYSDTSAYIPLVKYYNDNSLYPKDAYIQSITHGAPMILFRFMAFFGGIIGLEWAFFLMHILTRILFIFSLFYFSYSLFGKKSVSYLSTIMVLSMGGIALGSVMPTDKVFVQAYFVYPFLIASLYFFIKEKWMWAFGLLGLAFNIHILYSLTIACMYGFWFLINLKKITKKEIYSLIILLVLISPVFIGILKNVDVNSGNAEYFEFMRARVPHEIFPLSWSIQSYVLFGGLLLLFLFSLKSRPYKDIHGKIKAFLIAIIILCVFGFIFSEFIPLGIVMKWTPIRMASVFFTMIAWIYIANWIITQFEDYHLSKKIMALLIIAVILVIWIRPFFSTETNIIEGIDFPWVREEGDFYEMCSWVRENTSRDTLFLLDLFEDRFRSCSEKSVFVDWRTVSHGMDYIELAEEGSKRMKDVCNTQTLKEPLQKYCKFDELNQGDFERIMQTYNIHYLLLDNFKKEVNLKIIYKNQGYTVYYLEF
jgi:hypothetical protein